MIPVTLIFEFRWPLFSNLSFGF